MPGNSDIRQTLEVFVGLDEPDDEDSLRALVARAARCAPEELPSLTLLKRSIDARHGRVRLRLLVALGEEPVRELGKPIPQETDGKCRVIVVGAGPAGLFCAYQLARSGIACVVLDRGKKVQPRRRDLKRLNQEGVVDTDSNYCFGEGGAGTYSDGKLYTRSHKRGDVRDVIETLAVHGAPERILSDARPHIGSNRLPKVITAMRERLESVGCQFRFGARVIGLVGDSKRVEGVVLADGEDLRGEAVVLATGHSARDVVEMLHAAGFPLEAKAFAVGVRIEHSQALINKIQYGRFAGHPKLGAAPYRLAHQVDGRGVFSFCMCPGGWIVPAATEVDGVVVNGMSLSSRDSKFANSGLVVSVEPKDVVRAGLEGALGGIEFQRRIEQAAFSAGGGALRAPATRVGDFARGRGSSTVPETSYIPGLTAGDVGEVLGAGGIDLATPMREGLRAFESRMRGYVTDDAVLVGVESRTSSPVRIPRDADTLESTHRPGLFPCGEGAGYAGGIVSAALDAIRVARAVTAKLSR